MNGPTVYNVNSSPACAGLPVDLFFQADGEPTVRWAKRAEKALAICAGCPIRQVCLEDALRFPAVQQVGVAGGMTAAARVRLLRARRAARSDVTADISTSGTEVAA